MTPIVVRISEATAKDIDLAVDAAQHAYNTAWGLKVPGNERGKLLTKLAILMEENADELAALETLDNGKSFAIAKDFDVSQSADTLRYYDGWCDKHPGKTI